MDRYVIVAKADGGYLRLDENGDLVLYEDHKNAITELEQENARLREALVYIRSELNGECDTPDDCVYCEMFRIADKALKGG